MPGSIRACNISCISERKAPRIWLWTTSCTNGLFATSRGRTIIRRLFAATWQWVAIRGLFASQQWISTPISFYVFELDFHKYLINKCILRSTFDVYVFSDEIMQTKEKLLIIFVWLHMSLDNVFLLTKSMHSWLPRYYTTYKIVRRESTYQT